MSKGGAPVTVWTEEHIKSVKQKLNEYIDETDIPIIAEFAYKNDIRRAALYECPELAYTVKKAIEKKESALEREALHNGVNVTMAIFSLKQLGWRDKTDHEHKGNITINVIKEEEDI